MSFIHRMRTVRPAGAPTGGAAARPVWMRAMSLPCVLACLLACTCAAATAAPREVRVGLYENPPKIYTDAEQQPAGLFVDILEAVAEDEDWQLRYVPCEWSRCLSLLLQGEIDLMPDVAWSAERSQQFTFNLRSVAQGWSDVVVGGDRQVRTLGDLEGLRVAVLAGSLQQTRLEALMRDEGVAYQAVPVPTLAEGFRLVRDGGADAAVSNSFFTAAHAAQEGLVQTPLLFEPVTFYFAARPGANTDLLARIDVHLRAWKADADSPYFEAMRDALLPAQAADRFSRAQLIGIAIMAFLLLLGWALTMILRWQVRRRTRELERRHARLTHLLNATPVLLYQIEGTGEDARLHWQDGALSRSFGFVADQSWPLEHVLACAHEDDRDRVRQNFRDLPRLGRVSQTYRLRDTNNVPRLVRDEARYVPASPGHPAEIVGCLSDLTDARELADRLAYLTHHDELTSLVNRARFEDALAAAVQKASQESAPLALLLLNVDRLQRVNDTLGHDAGDAVLVEVGRRLREASGPGTTVARLGGDEFAVVLAGRADAAHVSSLAARLMDDVARPVHVGDAELAVTACIGVSLYPDDGDTSAALLMGADTALGHAKAEGRNRLHFVTGDMHANVRRWAAIERYLRPALERGELSVVYQPMATLDDGRVCAVEALLRWRNPELGDVSPAEFIPVAEEAGLIADIGEWVLRTACLQARAWRNQGLPPLRVGVNVSATQLRAGSLRDVVTGVLAESGLAPGDLELELTESVMLDDSGVALQQLDALTGLGLTLALDDFGTGYSSLGYLARYPFGTVKIDRSFVQHLVDDPRSAAIVHAATGIAEGLGLRIVAEGVESAEQLEFLRGTPCHEVQGYLLARPLPPDQLAARLQAGIILPVRGSAAAHAAPVHGSP